MSFDANRRAFLALSGNLLTATGITGSDIYLDFNHGFSAQVFYSSSLGVLVPTGSLTLQVANDLPSGSLFQINDIGGHPRRDVWANEGSTTAGNIGLTGSATNTSPKMYNISDAYYSKARFIYNATTVGTGSIEVWVVRKN